jgi:N-acetylglucosaminyldiphosphoundecaprenol N-acetyl-beta-D-mannosaminyltransferase
MFLVPFFFREISRSFAATIIRRLKRRSLLTHASCMQPLPTVPFLGLKLARASTGEFIDWIVGEARERDAARRIAYLNAAHVNLAFESGEAAELFKIMDCLYADGQAVVWASRRLGRPVPERINAGDFTEAFFRRCAESGLRIGLVGGRQGEAQDFARRFADRVQGLNFVFAHHGYFSPDEAGAVFEALDRADPDLVMLGMGAPRQERIAATWSERGKPRVWWCVGALFEYGPGRRRRAPVWMRRAGLEWLFRLTLEPGRLWRRYLIGNPKFVYRIWRARPIPWIQDTGEPQSTPPAESSNPEKRPEPKS